MKVRLLGSKGNIEEILRVQFLWSMGNIWKGLTGGYE